MDAMTELPAIGPKLRQRRKIRGLTLREAAALSQLSYGQLSQIENGVSRPSVASLQKICFALQMPISWLFEEPSRPVGDVKGVVRAEARRRLIFETSKMTKWLLTPDDCTDIQMIEILIEPGGGVAPDSETRPGAKCATVIYGSLMVSSDGKTQKLGPGDSFGFNTSHPNRYWCEGPEPVRLLMAISPALY